MDRISNYSLLAHNTFGINVNADLFIEYNSTEELSDLIKSGALSQQKYLHIGSGSNLLFLSDYRGVVLHSAIKTMELIRTEDEFVFIKVGSGVIWDDFVSFCVERGWYGAENLSLIPGEVGASAIQNIGAYGVEVKDLIYQVNAIDVENGNMQSFSNKDCTYDYRYSIFKGKFKNKFFITEVVFKLSLVPNYVLDYGHLKSEVESKGELNLKSVRNTIIEIRQAKLPDYTVLGNAGSFFMNPIISREKAEKLIQSYPSLPIYKVNEESVKVPAGWLIEQSGWKGRTIGNVGVYKYQALVLVNLGNAKGNEVKELAQKIIDDVLIKFQIELIPEVNYII